MANIIVNGFNVGTELSTVILAVNGGPTIPIESIGHLKEINAKQEQTALSMTPVLYGGRRIHRNIYHDFTGRMVVSRFNGDFTNLVVSIMQNFQQTGAETYFSIYWIIQNTTMGAQGIDEYNFQNCVVDNHDMGNWGALAEIDQALSFRSQQLVITGSNTNVLQNGPSV